MEYRNGMLYETRMDRIKDYAKLTTVTLPGLVALWCWGAFMGINISERYHRQEKPQVQIERIASVESGLDKVLEQK